MTLPHVVLGQPHVAAHNDERDAINADTSTLTSLAAAIDAKLDDTILGAPNGAGSLNANGHQPISQAKAGDTVVVQKDSVTGFWPSSYAADGSPVYTSGSASAGVRPTSRSDVFVIWKGPGASPAIVSSGTGGMLDNVDMRFVTT